MSACTTACEVAAGGIGEGSLTLTPVASSCIPLASSVSYDNPAMAGLAQTDLEYEVTRVKSPVLGRDLNPMGRGDGAYYANGGNFAPDGSIAIRGGNAVLIGRFSMGYGNSINNTVHPPYDGVKKPPETECWECIKTPPAGAELEMGACCAEVCGTMRELLEANPDIDVFDYLDAWLPCVCCACGCPPCRDVCCCMCDKLPAKLVVPGNPCDVFTPLHNPSLEPSRRYKGCTVWQETIIDRALCLAALSMSWCCENLWYVIHHGPEHFHDRVVGPQTFDYNCCPYPPEFVWRVIHELLRWPIVCTYGHPWAFAMYHPRPWPVGPFDLGPPVYWKYYTVDVGSIGWDAWSTFRLANSLLHEAAHFAGGRHKGSPTYEGVPGYFNPYAVGGCVNILARVMELAYGCYLGTEHGY